MKILSKFSNTFSLIYQGPEMDHEAMTLSILMARRQPSSHDSGLSSSHQLLSQANKIFLIN